MSGILLQGKTNTERRYDEEAPDATAAGSSAHIYQDKRANRNFCNPCIAGETSWNQVSRRCSLEIYSARRWLQLSEYFAHHELAPVSTELVIFFS